MGFNHKGQGIKGSAPAQGAYPNEKQRKSRDANGYHLPPQEDIEKCLNCERPECTNCQGNTSKQKYYIPAPRIRRARGELRRCIMEMYEQGYSYREIAIALGTTRQTVSMYVKQEREKEHESNKQHHTET